MGTVSFPGIKSDRSVALTPHPLLVPWSRKSRAVRLISLWAVRPVQSLSACTRVHFTFTFYTTPWVTKHCSYVPLQFTSSHFASALYSLIQCFCYSKAVDRKILAGPEVSLGTI